MNIAGIQIQKWVLWLAGILLILLIAIGVAYFLPQGDTLQSNVIVDEYATGSDVLDASTEVEPSDEEIEAAERALREELEKVTLE